MTHSTTDLTTVKRVAELSSINITSLPHTKYQPARFMKECRKHVNDVLPSLYRECYGLDLGYQWLSLRTASMDVFWNKIRVDRNWPRKRSWWSEKQRWERLDNKYPPGYLSPRLDRQTCHRKRLIGGLYSNGPVRNLIYFNMKARAQINNETANQIIIRLEYHSCEQVNFVHWSAW